MSDPSASLRERAAARGLLVSHVDAWGRPHTVPDATLAAALDVLGPAPEPRYLPPCQRARAIGSDTQVIVNATEGITVEYRGAPLPGEPGTPFEGRATTGPGGTLVLEGSREPGVYGLQLTLQGHRAEGTFVLAPERALPLPVGWGLFAPLHALWDDLSPAHGDVATLGRLATRVEAAGGVFTATLPLLPRFLEPARVAGRAVAYEPSPYAPVSRVFWDEMLVAAGFVDAAPTGPYVEPGEVWRAAWPKLVDAAQPHRAETEAWLAADPERAAYAAFRGEGDEVRRLTYGWAQMQAHARMEALGAQHPLLLDLPLGTHGLGFDVTRHPERFLEGLSVGAPPDALFAGRQGWGFPPMDLPRAGEDGFAHLRRCLELHMAVATVLRVDHVAWLHRLYCIPAGHEPTDGVYLAQPAWVTESLYGILTLLSERHDCAVVGEDLGTVPPEVREAMTAAGLARSWVLELELGMAEPAPVPPGCLASPNTHDLPLFAAWWAGEDVALFRSIGLLDAAAEAEALEGRAAERERLVERLGLPELAGPAEVLDAALEWLAASPAGAVMVSLEDLWLETRPQNVPGTSSSDRPNWRGRAARPVDALGELVPSSRAPRVLSEPA